MKIIPQDAYFFNTAGHTVIMKKLIAMLTVLFLFSSMPVLAEAIGETAGYVADIHGNLVHVAGEPLTPTGRESVIVNINNAPIYNLISGFRAGIEDIAPGMEIRVAYRTSAKTEPFPAVVAWLNWDHPNAAVFTVTVSENIYRDAGGTVFLSADGKYRVSLSSDTIMQCPYYGSLSHHEIRPGMEFFIWVDMITASTPALVYPDKIVLVS